MPVMTSQLLKSVKTQKSRYLKNEALFFVQVKKFIDYTFRATLLQKTVLQPREPLRLLLMDLGALGSCSAWEEIE